MYTSQDNLSQSTESKSEQQKRQEEEAQRQREEQERFLALTNLRNASFNAGSTESKAQEAKEKQEESQDPFSAEQKSDGRELRLTAQRLISGTLEKVPEAIKQEVSDRIMSNFGGALAAAERTVTALEKGEKQGGAENKGLAGQISSTLVETVWRDPNIPTDRKLEMIFKLMAELLAEAEAIDSKLLDQKKEQNRDLEGISFEFPRTGAQQALSKVA